MPARHKNTAAPAAAQTDAVVLTPGVALSLVRNVAEAEILYGAAAVRFAEAIKVDLVTCMEVMTDYVSSLDSIEDVTKENALALIEDMKNPPGEEKPDSTEF